MEPVSDTNAASANNVDDIEMQLPRGTPSEQINSAPSVLSVPSVPLVSGGNRDNGSYGGSYSGNRSDNGGTSDDGGNDGPKKRRRKRAVVYRVPREVELQNALVIEREKSNAYSSTKSVGQEFLNMSIIIGHVQTIISLVAQQTPLTSLQIALIVLICVVLSLQVILTILVALLYKTSGEQVAGNLTATGVNFFVTFLTMISLVCNASITIIAGQMKLTM